MYLIVHLTVPSKTSVTHGIMKAGCSVAYSSVADAARAILHLGRGTEMAKIDTASASRMAPVHPKDH